jgi:thiaminase/transcriptional activator TenA
MRIKYDDLWQKSLNHPFIEQLAEGNLDKKAFRYYLIQDYYYLAHFSKIYDLIVQTTEDDELRCFFEQASRNFENGEKAIRQHFFEELLITTNEIETVPIAPTAYHYVSHIYRNFYTEAISVTLAALLPCPWLYFEISSRLIHQHSPEAIYQRWIEAYSGDEIEQQITKLCQIIDFHAQKANESELKAMEESFKISSQLELDFWQMALSQEQW